MKYGVLFTVFLIWLSSSSLILRHASYLSDRLNGEGTKSDTHANKFSLFNRDLVRRDERDVCSAPSYDPNDAKRSLDLRALADNATIHQRMELPAPGNIKPYILKQTKEAVPVVWPQTTRDGRKKEYDTNTSVFEQYKHSQDTELSLGTTHLVGCTMLIVVSRKGVYIGHFWESISFYTDKDNSLWEKHKEDQNKIFFETVIKGMRDGKGVGPTKQQDSLRRAAPDMDDPDVRAYLIRPNKNAKEDGDYRVYWDQMKEEVFKYFPTIKNDSKRWTERIYVPVKKREKNQLKTTVRGRLLFKYDAKHPKAGVDPNAAGAILTEHRAMMWSEDEELHNDAWT